MAGCQPIPDDLIGAVLAAFRGAWGGRNRAFYACGLAMGFRASELLSLDRSDVITAQGQIVDRVMVRAEHMKGQEGKTRARTVKLNAVGRRYLEAWLIRQAELGYCAGSIPVFCKASGQRVSYWMMWRALKDAFTASGLDQRGFATHSLRKTFALKTYDHFTSRLISGAFHGDPIVAVCEALGHADIRATRKYIPTPDVDEAIDGLYDGLI